MTATNSMKVFRQNTEQIRIVLESSTESMSGCDFIVSNWILSPNVHSGVFLSVVAEFWPNQSLLRHWQAGYFVLS